MEQKFDLNRCVTVIFHNQTSKVLNKTSGDFNVEWGEHNVQAPGVINPGDTVQWDQKSDASQDISGSAAYSFALDGGSTGSLSMWWSNPREGSNQYSVSSDPSGLFFISYSGGGGTEATIQVRFYEFAYDTTQCWDLVSCPAGQVVEASDSGAVISVPNSEVLSSRDLQWIAIDPTTGATAWSPGYNGKFKIFNRSRKAFLTASDWQNNKVCLYVGDDGPDQYWYWNSSGGGPWLMNAYSNLALTPSGDGLVVASPDPSQWWDPGYHS